MTNKAATDRRVDYEVSERIATISMNRPPVNAIDHAMIDAIHHCMREADADDNVRAVVITSSLDRMYCGGMDLRMVAAGTVDDLRNFVYKFYIDTLDIQYSMRKPTLAAINGPARGAGMTLSVSCDVSLAADDVDLGYPEIDIGVIPAIHYVHLPRQISRHKAFELLFGGQAISTQEAAELGIINHAVPRDQLIARTREIAGVFAKKSAAIMALGRQSFMRANDLDYRRNIENQIETLCNVFNTDDSQEALRAFLEKRTPKFQND